MLCVHRGMSLFSDNHVSQKTATFHGKRPCFKHLSISFYNDIGKQTRKFSFLLEWENKLYLLKNSWGIKTTINCIIPNIVDICKDLTKKREHLTCTFTRASHHWISVTVGLKKWLSYNAYNSDWFLAKESTTLGYSW